MPSNPMQKKVRNSFLLGMFITLLIIIAIGAVVFFMIIQPKLKKKQEEETYIKVCQLKADVKSGDEITLNLIEEVELLSTTVPSDAVSKATLMNNEKTIAKVNLGKGAVISQGVIANDSSELNNTTRYVEYNMITIPTTIYEGDYVDIRLRLTNTQDLIVVSKKKIESIYEQTVGLYLTEEEIVILNSAIVESYIMTSSELYMAKYIEPGLQTAATYTYSPTDKVVSLIQSNPNIVGQAREEIAQRYYNSGAVRNPINDKLNEYSDEAKNNVETQMKEQIEAARKAREDYLSELNGY